MGTSTSDFATAGLVALTVALAGCGRGEDATPPAAPPARHTPPARPGFTEIGRAAGLDFRTHLLPGEQGEKFKINLYDHGCGVAIADVDGDGDDDVYLLSQLGRNGLYLNDGTGRFTDATDASGVAVGDRVCVSAVFGDVDRDGDQDLYVTSTRGGNLFFLNDGRGRFRDATAAAGLSLVAHSQCATFFDYDGDGSLDLFVGNTAKWTLDTTSPDGRYYEGPSGLFALARSTPEKNVLYRNDGKGRFTDVTAETGVAGPGWSSDAAVLDYDGDGRPDLLVGNMFGSSSLFHNEGGVRFQDVARTVLGPTSWGTVGVKAFDSDGDGRLDLMLADMHSDMWIPLSMARPAIEEHRKYAGPWGPTIDSGVLAPDARQVISDSLHVRPAEVLFGNTLFRDAGGGRFEEVSGKAGAETFWPWGIAAADFDGDGFEDVFLASGMGYPLFYWPNRLLMNRGDGTFEERSRVAGLDPPPGGEFLEQMVGDRVATRSSRAAAVADFDGDGRPDLLVVNLDDRVFLYHNDFPARPWVALRLTGTKSNRDAVGALVTIRAGGRTLVRPVESASGYLAQSSRTLLFGLGSATAVDSCEIRWPGGLVQRLDALRLGAVNAVTEPSDAR